MENRGLTAFKTILVVFFFTGQRLVTETTLTPCEWKYPPPVWILCVKPVATIFPFKLFIKIIHLTFDCTARISAVARLHPRWR